MREKSILDQYVYVDAQYHLYRNGEIRPTKWKRLLAEEVGREIIEPSRGHNCFQSIQRYRDAVSDRESAQEAGEASIEREYQSHYCGLFFDFDAKPEGSEERWDALARARVDTVQLVDYFLTRFQDMNPAHVQVWFSGGKGFHVLIRPEVFDIKPHPHLTYMIKNMAWSVADELRLKTLDRSVYSVSRMWRIENTVHQITRLRKIELDLYELRKLPIRKVMEIAKEPRVDPVYDALEYRSIAPLSDASAWWDEWERYFEVQQEMIKLSPRKRMVRPVGEDGLPACMRDLTDGGPKPDGRQRNHVSMVMATYWKDMGYSRDMAQEHVDAWTTGHYADRGERELREAVSNGRSAVRSVYSDRKYAFTCASIRACAPKGSPNPVACTSPDCKWVPNPEDQEPMSLPTVHLSEASRGVYLGKKLRIPVHVSGKQESPYGLPLRGKIRCPQNPDKRCNRCPFMEADHSMGADGEMEWSFTTKDRDLLRLIDVNDNMKKGTIKAANHFPHDCYRARVEYGENSNIECVRLIPMIDYKAAYREDAINDDEVTAESSEHSVRDGYYIGHGIEANQKYHIDAYTFLHPKDQRVVHVFSEAQKDRNDIRTFRVSNEMRKRLKVFQPKKGQTVEGKMQEIHQDLLVNVHGIGGLPHLAKALDLAFHSVIGFNLGGRFIEKGWFELLVVGDSSMGKSTIAKAFIKHFRVGEIIPCEGATRTGLAWASQQINGKWTLIWGKIPQNDRRLLVLDEFGEMDPEQFTQLTQMRSEGKASGQGVSNEYKTWARTRLIYLSNVRGNRDVASYSEGIRAVRSLFNSPADLRRMDIAIAIKKGEVPRSTSHHRYKDGDWPHTFTSDLCHNLVMWAWSRDPRHVFFTEEAEDTIYKLSGEMGEMYNSDIYLVETNDQKHKLARVACAVAARLFSTDDRCMKLIVTAEHVRYAAALFDECYGRSNPKSTMKYYQYAYRWQEDNAMTEERKNLFLHHIEKLDGQGVDVIRALLGIQDFRKRDLEDQLPIHKSDFSELWKFLLKNKFVVNYRTMYRKSGQFNELLNSIQYDTDLGEDKHKDIPF